MPRFIGKFITITKVAVHLAVVGTIAYCSITSMYVYYLIEASGGDGLRWLYYLNLVTILISLVLTVIITKVKYLHSTRSFDLMEMKHLSSFVVGEDTKKSSSSLPNTPEIRIEAPTPLGSVKSTDRRDRATSTAIDATASMPKSSSASSFYLYQVAVNNAQQSPSEDLADVGPPPAVVPYRLKLRIASIASILSFRKNS